MKNNILFHSLATIAFVSMILVNALANILPLNGLNTGEVSARYPNLFTPAGITFSIWSVIYAALLGFVVLIWSRRNDFFLQKLLPLFTLSCVLNLSWIFAWHYLLPGLSFIVMLLLLVALIRIFLIVYAAKETDIETKIWVVFPFTLYLAWISVATIANLSALLVSWNWNGGFLSPEVWTVVMMLIATMLAVLITIRYKAPIYAAVVIWALAGIYIRWHKSDYSEIIYGSIFCILLLTLSVIYALRNSISTRRQGKV